MSNDKELGTPKTFDEALFRALCVGPLSEIRERSYRVFKDYLAQKFGTAMLQHPEAEEILKKLFDDITRRS
ncbi:MAG: hypothetical protein OEW15_11565 [Nitrospirota bacterium]|nr:hypothetical protein [Nitrospirota bacterium]